MKKLSESEVLRRRNRAIRYSVVVSVLLTLVKTAVALFTGSLSLLASALDSLGDFFISLTNTFILKKSESSPTKNFRYGFGKIEGIASLFQGIFIIAIGISIVSMSVLSFWNSNNINNTEYALLIMGISTLVVFLLSTFLQREAKITKSLVLESDSAHYRSDVLANISIFGGILLVSLTNFFWIDSLFAGVIAIFIIRDGLQIIQKATGELMDKEVEPETQQRITETFKTFITSKKISGAHCIKSRRSGIHVFVEAHLVFYEGITLRKAHDISHQVEDSLSEKIPHIHSTFHLDPVDDSPH